MVFIKYALIGHVNKALDKVEISTYKRRLLLILLISAFIESIFIVFRKLYWFSAERDVCIFSMLMFVGVKYRLNHSYNENKKVKYDSKFICK